MLTRSGLEQVSLGALFGTLAARVVDGSVKRSLAGWHPFEPSTSAKTLALTTATATGIPSAAPALLARPQATPSGASWSASYHLCNCITAEVWSRTPLSVCFLASVVCCFWDEHCDSATKGHAVLWAMHS